MERVLPLQTRNSASRIRFLAAKIAFRSILSLLPVHQSRRPCYLSLQIQ